MKDFDRVFGLPPKPSTGAYLPYNVTLIEDRTSESNILTPGQQPALTFRLSNNTGQPIRVAARIDVVRYGTKGIPGDVWLPQVFKIEDLPPIAIDVNLPAKGAQNIEVAATLPETFGAYAFVFDLGSYGRQFALSMVRTFAPTPRKLQFPTLSLDGTAGLPILKSLGIQAIRQEHGWTPAGDPRYDAKLAELDAQMKAYAASNITVLLTLESGQQPYTQPLGIPRPFLDAKDRLTSGSIDLAWLPKFDADFKDYVAAICKKYGWPNGPLTAVQLWNEPWEGESISGWGADLPRYREIYRAMAEGVEEARQSGAQVLVTGCDSSSNSMDKLFSDGKDELLPWFDACTIHYQGLWSPALYRAWRNRTGPRGRVKIWDTESWVANTDDRIPAVIAGDRAAGYDRAMGMYWGNISQKTENEVRKPDGHTEHVDTYFPWSPAAALGAAQHFLGQREFRELLFQNGLPWVMVFDGENDAEDGTVVVTGDLREAFNPEGLPFRNVKGLAQQKNQDQKEPLRKRIAALPADSADRAALEGQLKGLDVLTGGTLAFSNAAGEFVLYDFDGNPMPDRGGLVTVPLDSRGFYLRTTGAPGSFERLVKAIATARIEGYEPLNIVAHDFTAAIGGKPALHLTLTNILNRAVSGTPRVTLGDLQLDVPPGRMDFQPHETKEVQLLVLSGEARPDNAYPLSFHFDAGADGTAGLAETLHVNVIAHRAITVDGNLDDWKGVLPQTVSASGQEAPSLTQTAWLPFVKFDAAQQAGLATAYLAYDESYFYFAAKIADKTPSPGMIRFGTRHDDDYFYPEVSQDADGKKAHRWPEGVRRFSYRKNPELPFGTDPKSDNVQIAFNVIPEDQKEDLLPALPGVMPGFLPYRDTDYEYALNPVAAASGGGTEIWRARVPGMPAKHFYPREPASPFDGPVTEGKLVCKQDGTTRIVEAAIPWREIPLVKKALDENRPVKFSFRVNDDHGPSMELAEGRSVSKQNTYAFHPDWTPHWANEVEFAFEK